MLAADIVSSYAETIQPIVRTARDTLASLGGDPQCVTELAGLIDETISCFPLFQLR
jgi:hypothetical protein